MKKILITGGFGFVGSLLVKHFLKKGLEVVVLEHPDALAPKDFENIEILRADITNVSSMGLAKCFGIDAVLHLAAQSSGPRSFSIPAIDIQMNVLGTLNVINWCLDNSIERLLFASSFVIYGDHPTREVLDEAVNCQPKSVYATSKLACEHLLSCYAQPKGIKWNSLRMYNVYGPGQDITKPDQGVVGIFMNMLIHSDVIQIKGSLARFRDLIYIDDVIQGWDRCLFSDKYNQAFNLGTGVKTTYETLIYTLANILDKSNRLIINEEAGTPGDMLGCVANISKIQCELGFQPQVQLEEGLSKMLAWIRGSSGGAIHV